MSDHITETIRKLRVMGDEHSLGKAILLETGFLQNISTFTENSRKNNIPADVQTQVLAQCFASAFYSGLATAKGERLLIGIMLFTDLMQSACEQVAEAMLEMDK